MTRFASPALSHPDQHLPAAAIRAAIGAASVVLTAALWFAAGSQAGQFGGRDTTARVELEPVVVSGRRLAPEHPVMVMGAAAADCGNTSAARNTNRVTLEQ